MYQAEKRKQRGYRNFKKLRTNKGMHISLDGTQNMTQDFPEEGPSFNNEHQLMLSVREQEEVCRKNQQAAEDFLKQWFDGELASAASRTNTSAADGEDSVVAINNESHAEYNDRSRKNYIRNQKRRSRRRATDIKPMGSKAG